jgi:hypothetical protein
MVGSQRRQMDVFSEIEARLSAAGNGVGFFKRVGKIYRKGRGQT